MRNKSTFVVVSFCCVEWSEYPAGLVKSLERFDIDHDVQHLNGKEAAAVRYSQAIFLKKMLKKHAPRPIVWLDPDFVLNRHPIQFDVQSTEVALYVFEQTLAINTSAIYFANTRNITKLLDMWIEVDQQYPDRPQAENVRLALCRWQFGRAGRIGRIPESYINGDYCGAINLANR